MDSTEKKALDLGICNLETVFQEFNNNPNRMNSTHQPELLATERLNLTQT